MTIKKFKQKLEEYIEDSNEFVVWNNKTMPELNENQLAICGEDDDEVFTFEIVKV